MKMFAIAMITEYNASSTRNMCFRWRDVESEDFRGCGKCVDDCGDERCDAAYCGECCNCDEQDIDHGNMLGTLDPNFLNPCLEKCALQIWLFTVISVRDLPIRSNYVCSGFLFLYGISKGYHQYLSPCWIDLDSLELHTCAHL